MFVYTEGPVTAGVVKNVIINQIKNMYINTHFKEILRLNTRNMQHSKNRCS